MDGSHLHPYPSNPALKQALDLASAGFRVFPVVPGGKTPAVSDWPALASWEADKVREMFEDRPNANIGIATGRCRHGNLAVIDIDMKHGKNGEQSLADFCRAQGPGGGLPETSEVKTPSGGRHLYFLSKRPLRNFAGRGPHSPFGDGVDLRGEGGFVVAPGSTIDGKPYTLSADRPMAAMPDWMEQRAGLKRAKDPEREKPVFRVDHAEGLRRAREFLAKRDGAVEGAGGDDWTFKTACELRDLGLSPETCMKAMREWNADKCSPPWSEAELLKKICNAFEYGGARPGSKAPEANFDIIPSELDEEYGPEISKRQTSYYGLAWAHEIEPDLEQNWLIEGVLPSSGLAFLVAQSNQGKSFLALDMGMAVALGAPWFGRETERGAVVYLAAEGNLKPRIKAYRLHHKLGDGPIALGLIGNEKECNLFSAGTDLNHLVNAVTSAAKACGQPVRLIVLDTLACVARGADENSGKDMGALFGNCRRLQSATGALVMIVHHLGKDPARGARGHSSMFAAVDTALQVDNFAVRIEKQRDGKTGDRFGFRLTQVVIGQDRRGRPVESCIVEQDAQALAFERKAPRPDSHAGAALEVLRRLAEAQDAPAGGVIAKWVWLNAFCKERFPDDRKRASGELNRAIKALGGWIEPVGKGFRVVDDGFGGFDGID